MRKKLEREAIPKDHWEREYHPTQHPKEYRDEYIESSPLCSRSAPTFMPMVAINEQDH